VYKLSVLGLFLGYFSLTRDQNLIYPKLEIYQWCSLNWKYRLICTSRKVVIVSGHPKEFSIGRTFAQIFIVLSDMISRTEVWRGVGGSLTKSEKKPAQAGWPRHLALVRTTSRAEVDVISAQLCSCNRAIFPSLALSWLDRSVTLIIVDASPNLHNTGFFPDCYLLWVTDGSIRMPYLARYSEIFKKLNFQVVKSKSTFIWKMLSQAELDHVWLQSLVCLPPLSVTWLSRTLIPLTK